jgi:hypothetical protein
MQVKEENKKRGKNFYIKQGTIKQIEEYASEHGMYRGDVIEEMAKVFFKGKGNSHVDDIAAAVYARLNKDLVRIRLGTNNADKNSQILIELLNVLAIHHDLKTSFATDVDEHKSGALRKAEADVQSRIDHYKQRKDDRSR